MVSSRSKSSHSSKYAAFTLSLASNENLSVVLNAGSTAQARRRRSASLNVSSSSIVTLDNQSSAVCDGYQSSDDSLYLPHSAGRRRARANTSFLPPLPGCSRPTPVASAAAYSASATAAAIPPSISISQAPRRISASSISSAFSWQESIFHVRRLSGASEGQVRAQIPPRVERGGRSLVPPPRYGSHPHPDPLRSNPVFEGGRI